MTWAQAARDIFVAAINKGQLPVLGIILVILLMLYRMPPQDITAVAQKALDHLISLELLGYLLSLLTIVGWFLHARYLRREQTKEYDRIGREKSEAQNKAAGKNFPSSKSE